MVDPGSSPNIMPLSTLEEVGIFLEHGVEQSIEISNFGGDASLMLGYINVDLVVGSSS